MHALGVDVGYGHTKAVSSLRDRPLTFPSVVGHAEAEAYRLDLNSHDHVEPAGGSAVVPLDRTECARTDL